MHVNIANVIVHFNRYVIGKPLPNTLLERFAVQELHYDKWLTLSLPDLVNGADVGVVECRCCPCLTAEALQCVRVISKFGWKKLDRNESAEFRVLSLIDDTHPAATEFLGYAVMRDGLTSQLERSAPGAECYGKAKCYVNEQGRYTLSEKPIHPTKSGLSPTGEL
jgi:hypothetical protein